MTVAKSNILIDTPVDFCFLITRVMGKSGCSGYANNGNVLSNCDLCRTGKNRYLKKKNNKKRIGPYRNDLKKKKYTRVHIYIYIYMIYSIKMH